MSAPMSFDPRVWTAHAHAKVNLHLGVAEPREDGFHELATVFQSLSIHDVVTLEEVGGPTGVSSSASRVLSLEVDGPYALGVPADSSNLASRAVDLVASRLREKFGPRDLPQVALYLTKGIPAAGGMAGGSADCAAALRLADRCFSQYYTMDTLGEDELMGLAAQLGSDVPFTLMGGTALGTGRGEQLTPMISRGSYAWAFISSHEGLSTPAVFAKLDELRAAGRGVGPTMDTTAVGQALMSGKAQRLAGALANDLQAAAVSLRPDLRKTLKAGKAAGALCGIVSGSGPTCAFLCEDEGIAADVVSQVTVEIPKTRGFVATGPAPGAVLI